MRRNLLLLPALILATTFVARAADDTTDSSLAVKAIAPQRLQFATAKGSAVLPLYVSADWTRPLPNITRALLVFHGKLRNADVYNASSLKAIHTAGAEANTLLITPQFLSQIDVDTYHLPANTLHFAPNVWMGGGNAIEAPLSSFDAIDAILLRLSDRKLFPNLKTVVLAGHSGGGQIVQRYAVVGRGAQQLLLAGVHVRYVVANPSSYVYFSLLRPDLHPKDAFTFALPVKSCHGHYNYWKFGVLEPPPYVGNASFAKLEEQYIHRDVIYLLGTDDTDPNHPALDKTCSAEDEGPYRFFRGNAYFAYLIERHPELATPAASQQLWYVRGVGHDGDKMFNSRCGLDALFDNGSCPTRVLHPIP